MRNFSDITLTFLHASLLNFYNGLVITTAPRSLPTL
jgi:hypothetical protein